MSSSGGSMGSGGAPRKRKRSEKGSGSKRRDQESSYIEELAELITASLSGPESLNMKPDKFSRLQETINQFKRIKQQQEAEHGSEVQHSHVSSSKPGGMIAGDSLGNVLLEALDGFLFVVNNQGEIEFVTENVQTYVRFKKEDLIGSSIYNFIHMGDHKPFANCLMPTASAGMWQSDPNTLSSRNRSFNCRMLVKIDQEDSLQEQIYENMKCSAILKPAPEKDNESSSSSKGDVPSHLFCIAQLASVEEKSAMMPASSNPNPSRPTADMEQFTTQLDMNGQILMVDFSHVKPPYFTKDEMVGQMIYKFCHSSDRAQLQQHFEEAKEKGSSSTLLYRFKIYNNMWVFVITSTRVCRNPVNGNPEFMVAEHSVMREDASQSTHGHAGTSGVNNNTSNNSSSGAGCSTGPASTARLKQPLGNHPNRKGLLQALFPDGNPTNKSIKSSLGQLDLPTLKSLIHQQKQQHGMMGGNQMNNLESLKKSSLTNMLQQGTGSFSGAGGMMPGQDGSGMSYPATYGNNDKDGPAEKMPRLDRLSPEPNVASTTLQGAPSMDAGDDGDVFLPNKSQDNGPFRSQDMGNSSKSGMEGASSFRKNSSSNPSPDTNEDDKDLTKNTLLQKLLLEDIEGGHKKHTNNNSPTSSTTKQEGNSGNKGSSLCKDNKQAHNQKPHPQTHKNGAQGNRQPVPAGRPGGGGEIGKGGIGGVEPLLGKLLDGDRNVYFGSRLLPAEQPGFVSSTVVSTTTVLRSKSESDQEKDKDLSNQFKRKNVLLQQLLMEDEDSATSPSDNGFPKNDDSQNNDNTTSPTVSTTKPKLTSRKNGGGGGADGYIDEDSNGIVQQLLQAANNISEEFDSNQPNMIADFLKELEQSNNTEDAALMQNILGEGGSSGPATANENNSQFTNAPNQREMGMSSGPATSNVNTATTAASSHPPMSRQNSRGRMESSSAGPPSSHMPSQGPTPASSGGATPTGGYGSNPMESLAARFNQPSSNGHPMAQMQQMAPPNQTAPSQGPVPQLPPFPSQSPANPAEEQQLLQQLEQVLTSDNNLLSEIDDALGLNCYPDGTPMTPQPNPRASTPGGGGSGMLHSMLNNANQVPMSSQSMMPHMSPSPMSQAGGPMPQGGGMGFPGGGSMDMQQQQQQSQMSSGSMMGMMAHQDMPESGPMMRPGYRPQQPHGPQQMPFGMNPMQQQQQRMYNPMQQSGMPGQSPSGQFPPGSGNMMQPPQGGQFNQMIRQTPQYQLRHTLLMRRRQAEFKQQQMMQQQQQQQQQERQWQLQQQRQQVGGRGDPTMAGRPSPLAGGQRGDTMAGRSGPLVGGPHGDTMAGRSGPPVGGPRGDTMPGRSGPLKRQLMRSASVGGMPSGQPPQQVQQQIPQQVAAAVAAAANQQPNQQRLMHQQQHKNLMMLRQQQEQQTFIGQQVESQIVNQVDPQAFQDKLSDILNPSQGGAAPNVTIQKSPYSMGPNRQMPGGQMMAGPRGPPQGMPQQYQQGPNMGQFNQMMPQTRPPGPNFPGGGGGMTPQGAGMPGQPGSIPGQPSSMPGQPGMNPNSMQQYQDFSGNMGSNPMAGGAGNSGNMMQGGPGMMPGMSPQHPNMPMGNMPPNSMVPRNTAGINPNIPRPNLMASNLGPRGPSAGHLTRSMSMPGGSGMGARNSMSPNYPMQGNTSTGQFTNLQSGRGGGGTPNQMNRMPNSGMSQNSMGMSGGQMSTNTSSMPQQASMNNRWGGGNVASSSNQQTSQQQMYPTPVTTQAPSSMPGGQNMFPGGSGGGAMNQGNMNYQGMMGQGQQQQRGPTPGNQNVPVTSQAPTNNPLTNNPNIPTPTNIPTPVSLPPVSSSSSPGTRGMFPNSGPAGSGGGGVGGGGQNTPSELDMLGLTMELLDQNITGSPSQSASSTTNPTSQPDSTSTSGGQQEQYKSYVENSSREEAKRRFQDFCNISGAQDAPDANTRVTNLFRNQLLGSNQKDGGPQGASKPNMPHANAGSLQQQQQRQMGAHKQQPNPSSSQGQYPRQPGMDDQNQDNQDPDAKSNNSLLQKLLLE